MTEVITVLLIEAHAGNIRDFGSTFIVSCVCSPGFTELLFIVVLPKGCVSLYSC